MTAVSVNDSQSIAPSPRLLSLASIVADERVQARAETDAKLIDEYAEAMRNGTNFHP